MKKNDCILLCIGNSWRQDDGLGPKVGEYFLSQSGWPIDIQIIDGNMSEILEVFKLYKKIFIIDAFRTGSTPGKIFDLSYNDILQSSISEMSVSSHGLGLWQALEMAEVLGDLPPYLRFFGIEGESFDYGNNLSKVVISKIQPLITLVSERIIRETKYA